MSFRSILLQIWRIAPLPNRVRAALMWRLNTHYLAGVAAIIFDQEGRLLVLHHTYRPRYTWGLPGGFLKGNERAEEGLAREIQEETGLHVEVGRSIMVGSGYPDQRLDLVFACQISGGTFQPSDEVDTYRYCTFAELPADIMPEQLTIITWAFAHRRDILLWT